jgi:hypothetical protein
MSAGNRYGAGCLYLEAERRHEVNSKFVITRLCDGILLYWDGEHWNADEPLHLSSRGIAYKIAALMKEETNIEEVHYDG